jgi:hypothetical protein
MLSGKMVSSSKGQMYKTLFNIHVLCSFFLIAFTAFSYVRINYPNQVAKKRKLSPWELYLHPFVPFPVFLPLSQTIHPACGRQTFIICHLSFIIE